jgi:PPOX class probable F420-dependent enzyme
MGASTAASLGEARYLALTTFRRDGRAVTTPIWPAALHGRLYFGTTRDTGKVRRLRANPRVRVAPCNANASRMLGDWQDGAARHVADESTRQAFVSALRSKYGWQYRLVMLLYRLRGAYRHRAVYEIELTPAAS